MGSEYVLLSVLLKQKKQTVLDITLSFSAWHQGPSPEYECGKRIPLYPIRENSFVSIIMYLTCTIIVLLKKYMVWHTFNV
jgi:hypothetical protein